MLTLWIIIFVASLTVLVKGADWLLKSAERIGLAMGLSSFVIGVVIIGFGTSLPELVSSIAAILSDAPEIVAANVIGSNIANILLIIGFSAVVGGYIMTKKKLTELELPLLAASTVLFLGVAWDGVINTIEAGILLIGFVIYFLYTIYHKDDIETKKETSKLAKKVSLKPKDFILLVIGLAGLVVGSKYLIESVIRISEILNLATGAVALIAVAFGTSLPELLVSTKAVLRGKSDVALGNIFGSNIFNLLLVAGLPGLFSTLPLDEPTLRIGLPALIAATLIFIFSSVVQKIYRWEGFFYILIYIIFVGKLFNLF